MIEVNSIVRISPDFDMSLLKQGFRTKIELQRERILPLRIALLYFHSDWNFLGYCRVLSITQAEEKTFAEIEILTVFDEETKKIYKERFVEAGKFTGEAK